MIVQELAKRAGVSPHVVRFYSRIGLLDPKRDPGNGYKHFQVLDVNRLKFIRCAQKAGLTLAEITRLLQPDRRGTPQCCTDLNLALQARLEKTRAAILELRALENSIERLLAAGAKRVNGCDGARGQRICPRLEELSGTDNRQ